jgi:hypothetical protein
VAVILEVLCAPKERTEGLEMKALAIIGVALAVCWVIDRTMFYGQYFAALNGMLRDIGHFSR